MFLARLHAFRRNWSISLPAGRTASAPDDEIRVHRRDRNVADDGAGVSGQGIDPLIAMLDVLPAGAVGFDVRRRALREREHARNLEPGVNPLGIAGVKRILAQLQLAAALPCPVAGLGQAHRVPFA